VAVLDTIIADLQDNDSAPELLGVTITRSRIATVLGYITTVGLGVLSIAGNVLFQQAKGLVQA
jgi:hypothetical protein